MYKNAFAAGIATTAGVVVLFILTLLFTLLISPLIVLLGALIGWFVGLFFGGDILYVLNQLGVPDVTMWQLGAFLSFVALFVRSTLSTRTN